MKFRPLHDRVVVKRVEEEGKTKGGIIIPDTAKEKPMEGEVVAVGPGARDEKGALVRSTSRRATASCSASGPAPRSSSTATSLLIMKESDIMGIIEGSAAPQEGRVKPPRAIQSQPTYPRGIKQWQPRKSALAAMPASACCAASTFSPTRSR